MPRKIVKLFPSKIATNLSVFCLISIFYLLMVMTALTPTSYGFAADATATGLASHSSFHYELTRALAAAAGFNRDGEAIAIATEATDTTEFTGYSRATVFIENTERNSANSLYYHFARRGESYPQVAEIGAQANTCNYFLDSNRPCSTDAQGNFITEIAQIERWALYGEATLAPPNGQQPLFSYNGEFFQPVASGSYEAVGILLHALADSYSHEACIKKTDEQGAAFSGHKPSPVECSGQWHVTSEFGATAAGVEFSRAAGKAVWQVLSTYAQLKGRTPLWSDTQAHTFINSFVAEASASARIRLANSTYNQMVN